MHHGFEVGGIGGHRSSLWGYALPLPNKCVLLIIVFLQMPCHNMCLHFVLEGEIEVPVYSVMYVGGVGLRCN